MLSVLYGASTTLVWLDFPVDVYGDIKIKRRQDLHDTRPVVQSRSWYHLGLRRETTQWLLSLYCSAIAAWFTDHTPSMIIFGYPLKMTMKMKIRPRDDGLTFPFSFLSNIGPSYSQPTLFSSHLISYHPKASFKAPLFRTLPASSTFPPRTLSPLPP
jgi:hypothetical protein